MNCKKQSTEGTKLYFVFEKLDWALVVVCFVFGKLNWNLTGDQLRSDV